MDLTQFFQIPDTVILSITWLLGTITHAVTAGSAVGSLALPHF